MMRGKLLSIHHSSFRTHHFVINSLQRACVLATFGRDSGKMGVEMSESEDRLEGSGRVASNARSRAEGAFEFGRGVARHEDGASTLSTVVETVPVES